MKKIISISLISLSLLLSLSPKLVSAVNIFEEGVYKATDFNFSSDNKYIVQNVSKENKFNHIHPPYSQLNKGHSLSVMSYPNLLTEIEYDNFNSYLNDRVMNISY